MEKEYFFLSSAQKGGVQGTPPPECFQRNHRKGSLTDLFPISRLIANPAQFSYFQSFFKKK